MRTPETVPWPVWAILAALTIGVAFAAQVEKVM